MAGFFEELKHRRVYRVAIAYGVAGSALVQIGGTILPIFHAPEWVQQLFVAMLALGFPIALVLAWAFDITSTGIQRTVSPVTHLNRRRVWALALAGTAIAGIALAGYWFWHPWKSGNPRLTNVPLGEKSIAVLPFENLSVEKENAFFTDGVQDQILTDLAKVADLKVIGHTSVQEYRSGMARDLRKIGEQLGVAYLLQGSVQRSGNKLRISAQLYDSRNAEQLWADTYDRDLSDVFAIQSEIAQRIVSRLSAAISPQEIARIEEKPTQDMRAFDLYLRAKELVEGYLNAQDPKESFLEAVRLLDEATTRDPGFVLAYCYAARAHDLLYFLDLDPTSDRVTRAAVAAETALRLGPTSPEAHLSMADFYFRCKRDYKRADEELALAAPGLPNSVAFLSLSGYINRRQAKWEEAESNFRRAVTLDPRSINAVNLLVDTYVLLRRFDEAMAECDRAIAAGMNLPIIHLRREAISFSKSGEVEVLRKALAKVPAGLDVGGGETPLRILLAMVEHDYARANQELAASPRETFQEIDFTFYYPRVWYEAIIARAAGDTDQAKQRFAAVQAILDQRLTSKPNDPRTLAVLAQAEAGLGKTEKAVADARHALALMPAARDAYDHALVKQGLAQVYAWSGQTDAAVSLLEELMKVPGYLTYGYLRVDPSWDRLRGNANFERFLASLARNSSSGRFPSQ
jgi:TolB-like protein/Flp pilus assembly protein TadD